MMQDLGFNVTDPMDFAEGYVGCPAYGALVSCCADVLIKTSCMLGSAAYCTCTTVTFCFMMCASIVHQECN